MQGATSADDAGDAVCGEGDEGQQHGSVDGEVVHTLCVHVCVCVRVCVVCMRMCVCVCCVCAVREMKGVRKFANNREIYSIINLAQNLG